MLALMIPAAKTAVYAVPADDAVISESAAESTDTVFNEDTEDSAALFAEFESGSGTQTDPYIIKNAEQLKAFAQRINAGFSNDAKRVFRRKPARKSVRISGKFRKSASRLASKTDKSAADEAPEGRSLRTFDGSQALPSRVQIGQSRYDDPRSSDFKARQTALGGKNVHTPSARKLFRNLHRAAK